MNRNIVSSIQLAILIVLLCHYVKGQQNQVSPKLDFSDTENTDDSSVPVITARPDGTTSTKGRETDGGTDKNDSKSGPKIHGVRVTVDTGDAHKTKESKESVEITDLGKNKKRVGIHTDITFEITAGGDVHANKTSREQQDDEKEDASVPIFKGRGDSGHHKNRKPYDPKSQWNPNFSAERRGYDHSGRGRYPDYYPEYYPSNIPVYVGTSGGGSGSGTGPSTIYRQSDGWSSFVPRSSYWTTERSHSEAYRPNDVSATQGSVGWKPCYCLTNDNDYRRRRDSSHQHHHSGQENVVRPTSSLIKIIDSKLERTFSRK